MQLKPTPEQLQEIRKAADPGLASDLKGEVPKDQPSAHYDGLIGGLYFALNAAMHTDQGKLTPGAPPRTPSPKFATLTTLLMAQIAAVAEVREKEIRKN